MTNKELILKFEKLVSEERRATRAVLEHIALIEKRKAYLDLGFDGIYKYLTLGLGYSEGSAYRRIMAARILNMRPEIGNKLESGKLNLMQLAQVAKLSRETRQQPKSELFSQLESQGKSASEKILAQEFQIEPQDLTFQRTQRDQTVRLEITFSQEQFLVLEAAKSHLSHLVPDGDWAKVLTELSRQYTKKLDPEGANKSKKNLKKIGSGKRHDKTASVAVGINQMKNSPTFVEKEGTSAVPNANGKTPPVGLWAQSSTLRPRRRYIRLPVRRQIFSRAAGGCEYRDPSMGRRCGSTYQTQFDHIHPFSRGGSDEAHNLQLLCGRHNRAKGVQLKKGSRADVMMWSGKKS